MPQKKIKSVAIATFKSYYMRMAKNNETREFIDLISDFKGVTEKTITKGDTIADYLEKRDRIIFLLEGEADLVQYDSKGNKYILAHYYENDIFGELFHDIRVSGQYSVIATSDVHIIFISLSTLIEQISTLPNALEMAQSFIQMFRIKFQQLNFHIEMLSQRSIRNRLLIYFNYLASRNYQRVFYIPMNYTQLADFLSVDRSALMREIKNLEEDKIIDRHKYRIRLIS